MAVGLQPLDRGEGEPVEDGAADQGGCRPGLHPIVESDDLTQPTVTDTVSTACDGGEEEWEYPNLVLDYLYYQLFLSSTALATSSDFDPCGGYATAGACTDDWDQDGVVFVAG